MTFKIRNFVDGHNELCSLQQSLSTEPAIWLGIDLVADRPARMYLTQEMVRRMLPELSVFAATGQLPEQLEKADDVCTPPVFAPKGGRRMSHLPNSQRDQD